MLRSWLFVPGNRRDRFTKAENSAADVIIVDLEDAVASEGKVEARQNAAHHVQSRKAGGKAIALRINPLTSRLGLQDLLAIGDGSVLPDWVILPKVEDKYQIAQVRQILGAVKICALIETARGMAELLDVIEASPDALFFGAADFSSDIGVEPSWNALVGTRARLIEAAACGGIPVIDSPYFSLDDPAGLSEEAATAKSAGFRGKAAIHPGHVAVINEAFTPSENEIDWATKVLTANDGGVGIVDGRMIDEAIARRARRILRDNWGYRGK